MTHITLTEAGWRAWGAQHARQADGSPAGLELRLDTLVRHHMVRHVYRKLPETSSALGSPIQEDLG